MVETQTGGYRISDEHLAIRPPLDMCMPRGTCTANAMCLKAVYQIVQQSLRTPGVDVQADRLRPAIGWFKKAWRNTETVQFPERVVFLKTAFEALSGTSKSHCTARFLKKLFERSTHRRTIGFGTTGVVPGGKASPYAHRQERKDI